MVPMSVTEQIAFGEETEPTTTTALGRSAQIAANSDSWGDLSAERHLLQNHPGVVTDRSVWLPQAAAIDGIPWLSDALAGRPRLTRLESEVEAVFVELADLWEAETLVVSSPVELAIHPAYQRIIGLGLQAVPLLLDRVRRTQRYWFWALAAITGEHPALGLGDVEGAIEAWLDWGRVRGLIAQ